MSEEGRIAAADRNKRPGNGGRLFEVAEMTDLRRFDSDLNVEGEPHQGKKDPTITELVTPTLTLQELVAWVDAQLSDEERPAIHHWTARPEWTDWKEAA